MRENVTGQEFGVASYLLSVASYLLSVICYQLPVTCYQLPIPYFNKTGEFAGLMPCGSCPPRLEELIESGRIILTYFLENKGIEVFGCGQSCHPLQSGLD